jgi:hypothetical protein
MLGQLKRAFYKRSLSRGARQAPAPVSLDSARRVGIAFDASVPGNYVAISNYATKLKEQGKRVELLGYYKHRHIDGTPVFPYFNRKELNWYGRPNSHAADSFMKSDFDILINAYTEECLPLEYVSACSQSKLRIGLFSEDKMHCADVLIKPHDHPSIDQLIQDVDHYLQMIKLHEN